MGLPKDGSNAATLIQSLTLTSGATSAEIARLHRALDSMYARAAAQESSKHAWLAIIDEHCAAGATGEIRRAADALGLVEGETLWYFF